MDKIAVLDFGSQFTHLLANRIRNLGVYSEILDSQTPVEKLSEYKGIVLSGGPASVNASNAPKIDQNVYKLGVPILGICYGHQLILENLGGKVEKGEVGEYGLTEFEITAAEGHLKNFDQGKSWVYASHFDTVMELPKGFRSIGRTWGRDENNKPVVVDENTATLDPERKIYTLQFHPEVTHTQDGIKMIDEFLKITGAKREWDMSLFLDIEMQKVRDQVGDRNVFMLVSGGVDSTVAYVLLEKALGKERVYPLFIDTGFMRKGESEKMHEFLKSRIPNLHMTYADKTKKQFFEALKGVIEPEEKRKIIGEMFLKIQREVVTDLNMNPDHWLLGQGTIYPDTIESGGTKHADKIKTHHNRVPEIEAMIAAGKVIEPLKELYKDEVRAVGRKLGLSSALVDRHPFPGPGLAVRCLCAEGPVGEEFQGETELGSTWLLPLRSVGVQGDERTYRQPMLIDTQTKKIDWEALKSKSVILTNSDKRINRVLFTIALKNGESIKTVDVLKTTLTRDRIATLQEADDLVNQALRDLDPQNLVWQFPVVLVPVDLNQSGEEAIILRPISSENGMTANFTALDPEKLRALAIEILKIPGISSVLFDLTNKPPATIEWE